MLAGLAAVGASTLLTAILAMINVATGGWPSDFAAGAAAGGTATLVLLRGLGR